MPYDRFDHGDRHPWFNFPPGYPGRNVYPRALMHHWCRIHGIPKGNLGVFLCRLSNEFGVCTGDVKQLAHYASQVYILSHWTADLIEYHLIDLAWLGRIKRYIGGGRQGKSVKLIQIVGFPYDADPLKRFREGGPFDHFWDDPDVDTLEDYPAKYGYPVRGLGGKS